MLKLLLLAAALHAKKAELSAVEAYENVMKAQKTQVSLVCHVVREELKDAAAGVSGSAGVASSVTGTLKVASGGKAWLEMTVPSRQLAVSDGTALYVEMSDVKQVMKYDAAQLRKSGNFFLDLGSSIRHYAEASLKRLIVPGEGFDESKVLALELMPLNASEAGFERMRVWVDRKDWLVRQVELKLGGVDTRVKFEEVQVLSKADLAGGKAGLPASLFKYKAPKGYEVFDMTSMQ